MINYWVEKISCFDVFFFLLQSCFSHHMEVHYDEEQVSSTAKLLIGLLRKIRLCRNFYNLKLSFEKKDERGYTIEYAFSRNLEACCQEFSDKYFSEDTDAMKKAAVSYFALYVYNRLNFIAMVEAEGSFKNNRSAENIFYLVRHPLNSIIIPFYNAKNYTLRQSFFSLPWLVYYLRPLCHLGVSFLVKLAFSLRRPRTNITKISPAVWIEYYRDGILDFTFWRKYLHREDFDIVYYMDRPDSPVTKSIIKQIEGRGLKWIDMKFFSLAKWANLRLWDILNLINIIFCSGPLIKKIFKLEYNIRFALYKSVFQRFKVKILIQHQECSWIQVPQAQALERSNGIMLGFHWSQFFHYRYPMHLFPQHVYFVWGQVMHEWLHKKGNIIRYILPSGEWITCDKDWKKNLDFPSTNSKFVIAIFDSSVAYNANQTAESLNRFYLHVLGLIESNPSWGGIIKTKGRRINDFLQFPYGDKVLDKINSLTKDKRLIVLNPFFTPDAAFKHAHLSVCYSLNSAGIIAGMQGHRAIHWDCSGWLDHPFYKDPGQKIVYLDFDSFVDAIIKAGSGDRRIGDFSNWRRRFDYFNDLLAGKRVGGFIQSFMDEVLKSGDNNKSLDSAVKNYIEQNRIGNDFYALENIWQGG